MTHVHHVFAISLGSILALALAGCGGAPPMSVPENFVVLDDDYAHYDMRATNAHGVVISVRDLDNDVEGSLSFWVDAIKNKLRTRGGYALLEEGEVRAATGQTGHQLRFGRDENGQAYIYWLTVYAMSDRVVVVEAGGKREVFEEAAPQVEQALATLVLD